MNTLLPHTHDYPAEVCSDFLWRTDTLCDKQELVDSPPQSMDTDTHTHSLCKPQLFMWGGARLNKGEGHLPVCHILKLRYSEFDLSAHQPRPNTKTLMLTTVTQGPRCFSFTLIKSNHTNLTHQRTKHTQWSTNTQCVCVRTNTPTALLFNTLITRLLSLQFIWCLVIWDQ